MDFIEELINLLNTEKSVNKEFNIDGYKVEVIKDGNTIITKATLEEDNTIKDKIAQFKDIVENIDDTVFIDVLELVSKRIDIKEFDSLLNKQNFTKEEAENLNNKMSYFINTAHDYVNVKIKELYNTDDVLCKFF